MKSLRFSVSSLLDNYILYTLFPLRFSIHFDCDIRETPTCMGFAVLSRAALLSNRFDIDLPWLPC
jgi:hypothetical protein